MAQGFGQPGMNIGYQQQPGMVQPGFQQPGMNMGYPQQGGFPQQNYPQPGGFPQQGGYNQGPQVGGPHPKLEAIPNLKWEGINNNHK